MAATSSRVRIRSSRANGALSRGPKTEAGKLRSAGNNLTHGLYSKRVVLKNESQEEFDALLQQFTNKFHPRDDAERHAVQEMTAARWSIRRILSAETRLLAEAMDAVAPDVPDPVSRLTAAFESISGTSLKRVMRLEGRYSRKFHRTLNSLTARPTGAKGKK